MADLLKDRVQAAFLVTGVDYCGPFYACTSKMAHAIQSWGRQSANTATEQVQAMTEVANL